MRRTVLTAFAALLLFGPASGQETNEPNDTPGEATAVAIGEEFEFTLDRVEDRDLFRFVGPEAGTFEATIISTPSVLGVVEVIPDIERLLTSANPSVVEKGEKAIEILRGKER